MILLTNAAAAVTTQVVEKTWPGNCFQNNTDELSAAYGRNQNI